MLEAMRPDQLVVTVPEFASVVTDARLVVLDPKAWDTRVPKIQLGLMLMSAAVGLTGMIPLEALRAAAAGRFEAENLNAIEAGVGLAGYGIGRFIIVFIQDLIPDLAKQFTIQTCFDFQQCGSQRYQLRSIRIIGRTNNRLQFLTPLLHNLTKRAQSEYDDADGVR